MANYDPEYFKDYKEQRFKWRFWGDYIKRYTNKEDPILEIGCTYGYLFKYLKNYSHKFGIDVSEHAIKQAKILNLGPEYKVMNAEKLDFKDKTFKVIIAIDTLEHVRNPEKAIKEAARVLKEEGLFIMATPNPNAVSHKQKGKEWFAYKDKTHISIHPAEYWEELLIKNDFRIKRRATIDLFDFPYANKFSQGINLLSYKLNIPFFKDIGDNTVIIAKKN
ncbi:class I SAM-dependent methyltransferase [Candidatus Woesearchaeota archaeon]|nr:class I SAM-dependent methyltransferase [Candidatus Woesearchaeota archaeon]